MALFFAYEKNGCLILGVVVFTKNVFKFEIYGFVLFWKWLSNHGVDGHGHDDSDATYDGVGGHEKFDDGEDKIFATKRKMVINDCEYIEEIYTKEGLNPNLEGYQSEMNAHSLLSHAIWFWSTKQKIINCMVLAAIKSYNRFC